MGRVKSNHDPLRTVLTPLASAVILLVLTGWVGLAHQPEPEILSGGSGGSRNPRSAAHDHPDPKRNSSRLVERLGINASDPGLGRRWNLDRGPQEHHRNQPREISFVHPAQLWWDPRDATCAVRESNWRRTASHPDAHARTAVLCEPMLSGSNHHHSGGRHRMVDLGRNQRSRLSTPNFQTKLS